MRASKRNRILYFILACTFAFLLAVYHENNRHASYNATEVQRQSETKVPAWFEDYFEIYKEQMDRLKQGQKPRIARYVQGDVSGWGNRLRAMHYIVMLALYTRRLIVIDHSDYEVHYNRPYDLLIYGKDFADLPAGMTDNGEGWDQACNRLKAHSGDFSSLYPEEIVTFGAGSSPDSCLFYNQHFHDWLKKQFGTTSRYAITGMTTSMLLSNPKPEFIQQVDQVKSDMGWNEFDYHVTVQFRAFIDYQPTYIEMMAIFETFNEQAEDIILNFVKQKNIDNIGVWFTSDAKDIFPMFEKSMDRLLNTKGLRAKLLQSPFPPEHTSYNGVGSIKNPIKEFHIIGDSDVVICTGTTFPIFAAARTQFKMDYWVWDMKTKEFALQPVEQKETCKLDICF